MTRPGHSFHSRSDQDRLRDSDWDGRLEADSRRIAALLRDEDYRAIAESFWTHYLALDGLEAARTHFTGDRLKRRIDASAIYARTKYSAPMEAGWLQTTRVNADEARRGGIPVAALLRALAFSHSRTLRLAVR